VRKKTNKKTKVKDILYIFVILLFIFIFIALFIGAIYLAWKFIQPNENNENNVHVDRLEIKSINSKSLEIEKKDTDNYIIKYSLDNTNESFKINISGKDGEAIKKVKPETYSPFYNCQDRENRKMIYILLDVSGSMKEKFINSDNESVDINNQPGIKKIEKYLHSNNLQPGDIISLQFLGLGKKNSYDIDFIGPNIKYDEPKKNNTMGKTTLNITGIDLTTTTNTCSDFNIDKNAYTRKQLIDEIKTQYNLQEAEAYTAIGKSIKDISNDTKMNRDKFSSFVYIIFTDGQATIPPNYTQVDKYANCDSNYESDQQSCRQNTSGFKEDDKAYIIGIENEAYQSYFSNIFSNIKEENIIFE